MTDDELAVYALKRFDAAIGFGRKSTVELYHAGHAFRLIRDRKAKQWVVWQNKNNLPRPTVNQAIRLYERAKERGGVKVIEKLGRHEAKLLLGIVRPKELMKKEDPAQAPKTQDPAPEPKDGLAEYLNVPTTESGAIFDQSGKRIDVQRKEAFTEADLILDETGTFFVAPGHDNLRPIERLSVVVRDLTEQVEGINWERESRQDYLDRIDDAIEILNKMRRLIGGQAIRKEVTR